MEYMTQWDTKKEKELQLTWKEMAQLLKMIVNQAWWPESPEASQKGRCGGAHL